MTKIQKQKTDPIAQIRDLSGRRVAVLLFSYYPIDARPRRAAEALAEEGALVDLFCLQGESEPGREIIETVNVFRIPVKKTRGSKLSYFAEYGSFLMACFFRMLKGTLKHRYDLVHVHNMPDILVFSSIVPKLFGAKVILDLHDPMPELMQCIYSLPQTHWLVRLLARMEKLSIRFSDKVLTPNISFKKLFTGRGCPAEKVGIVMNSPESLIFCPEKHPVNLSGEKTGAFRIMHHGSLVARHGVDIAVHAIALLKKDIPDLEFHVYGSRTNYLDELKELATELGLSEKEFQYHGSKSHPEIAEAILHSDVGVVPNRRNVFTALNMPTRIFEYLAMGKPVLVQDTTGIRDYFDAGNMHFFKSEDPENLANAILDLYHQPEKTARIVEAGREVFENHRWEVERDKLLNVVGLLLPESSTPIPYKPTSEAVQS